MTRVHFSDYDQVLEYIYNQLPMYQRQGPRALKYDLSNILAFMEGLGNPHQKFKSIHVAGTNGKGSTAHLIAAVFQANGYQTGLYTSPHFKDYRERIKLNGEFILKEYVLDFFNENYPLIRDIKPSYFELSVALAFQYFADKQVDIALIEVGLGGRLDSTNIIHPMLSVITNISYDHMQTLGHTLGAIAYEKAGIIKYKVPVLIGEKHPETAPVFLEIAREREAPIHFSDRLNDESDLSINAENNPFRDLNSQYALTSIQLFKKYYPSWLLEDAKVSKGLQEVSHFTNYIGRWQKLNEKPLVIADGAHNTDGWEKILEFLDNKKYENVHFVLGFVADKSYMDILPMLPKVGRYYFCAADIPRALLPKDLKTDAAGFNLQGEAFSSVSKALEEAKNQAGVNDLILVSGSIFVVGEIL